MPVFMSVFDSVTGHNIGSTEIRSITDPLPRLDALFDPLPKPAFHPKVNSWVENNTGPLLPAYKDPEEINYLKPNSHLSRAGNPSLLGVDIRPIVPLIRQPEIKYTAPKVAVPPPVSPVILESCIRLNRQLEEQSTPVVKIDLEPEPVFWSKKLKDGSTLRGIVGGETHVHEYNDLGFGHVKIQSSGKKYSFNNFNETVESMLPDWMLRGDCSTTEREEPVDESDCFL